MKRLFLMIFLAISMYIAHGKKVEVCKLPSSRVTCLFFEKDTIPKNLPAFKEFAKQYFSAIRKKDTAFLVAHTIFPIEDFPSVRRPKIDKKYFCSHIQQLFPESSLRQIEKNGEFSIYTSYSKIYGNIRLEINEGGVDMMLNWVFLKKNGTYFFSYHTAEMG